MLDRASVAILGREGVEKWLWRGIAITATKTSAPANAFPTSFW